MTLACFKSYDVRGRIGTEIDASVCRAIGRAFAEVMNPGRVVLGRDGRLTSAPFLAAAAAGVTEAGADVADIGLCGSEEVYFATDHLGAGGGIMITASHNPADYNGMKLVGPGARPLTEDEFAAVAQRAEVLLSETRRAGGGGRIAAEDPRAAYVARVLTFVDPAALDGLSLLVNAGNGAAGPTFDALAAELDRRGARIKLTRLHHAVDGQFPHGVPNPLLPANRPVTARAVVAAGADLGVAWDGDFDRCFLFDATGGFVDGEYLVALLAARFLARHPGAAIVHDTRVAWNTRAAITAGGGQAVPARTGHAFMKAAMRKSGAVYGGEMSAHHYFQDFMFCDSGMIPWLLVAEALAREGRPLADLVGEMRRAWPSSGEINFTVTDAGAAIAAVEAVLGREAVEVDRLDGVSLAAQAWWVNLRRSSTEPVMRLNVETRGDRALLMAMTERVAALIRPFEAAAPT